MAVRGNIQLNNGNKGLQVWNDCKRILRIGFWHKSEKDLHAQIWNLQSITKNWQFCVKTSHTVYLCEKETSYNVFIWSLCVHSIELSFLFLFL